MVQDPIIAASAHQHGVDDRTILPAFNNPIRSTDIDQGFTMLIGPIRPQTCMRSESSARMTGRSSYMPCPPGVDTSGDRKMPRSVSQILSQVHEFAKRFEDHDPQRADLKDASALRAVRQAFLARARAERELADAVLAARADGHSWAAIGAMVGTSGEAARQRYGQPATRA